MKRLLLVVATLFAVLPALLAAEEQVTLKMGGYQMALPRGWERLNQPTNVLIQQRARSVEAGVAIVAGAFNLGTSVKEYVASGVAGMQIFDEKLFQKMADILEVPVAEVERMLNSQIGQRMVQQLKEAPKTVKMEYLGSRKIRIQGVDAYETHSKTTILSSGTEVYGRAVVFAGSSPGVIVQIGFSGFSTNIFEDKSLVGLIQKEAR